MIQLYVDGNLVFDSRVKESALLGLTAQMGINKGGAATIVLPPEHPAYDSFVNYRSVVEIYRDRVLRFRGRALYPTDDFYRTRTITCEGERCFLRDVVIIPGSTDENGEIIAKYSGEPADIFERVIEKYNSDVDEFKRFEVGTVDGIDDNSIEIVIEEAVPVSEVIDQLVEMCGGFIVFTTNQDGKRTINWYAEMGYRNKQVIDFGENLVDFSSTTANSDLATVIYPFGPKDETTGMRMDIGNSENSFKKYIQDDEAVAKYGIIAKAVIFEDASTAGGLLRRAQRYLNNCKNPVWSLELSAIDLSLLDKNIDSFMVGDLIEVRSKPHGINGEYYQLTEQSIDFLNPQKDRVTLGKDTTTFTGSGTSSAGRSRGSTSYPTSTAALDGATVDTEAIIEVVKQELSTVIQQTTDALIQEVSEQYATQEGVKSAISTTMTQLTDSFEFLFTELRTRVDTNDADARVQLQEIKKYVRIEDGNIILGEAGNEITLRLENGRILFLDDGAEVAYLTNKQLTVKDASFLNSMRIGSFAFIPRDNGNLSLVKVGG